VTSAAAESNLSAGNPQAQIEQLSKALADNQIGRIEILQIPSRVLTRARITPAMIEKQYQNKFTIRDINSSSYKGKFATALKNTSASQREEIPDLRWAVILYSQQDSRVGAIYFDKSGQYGVLNNVGVAFKGEFTRWLTATFVSCFEN
jgi:hypothetical protein